MSRIILSAALVIAAAASPALAQNNALKKPPRGGKVVKLPAVAYSTRDEAMAFADDLAQRRDLDREWVRRAISDAKFLPGVARLMQPAPAGTPKNWKVYRSRFIDPVRIAAGVKFWQANRETLARAE